MADVGRMRLRLLGMLRDVGDRTAKSVLDGNFELAKEAAIRLTTLVLLDQLLEQEGARFPEWHDEQLFLHVEKLIQEQLNIEDQKEESVVGLSVWARLRKPPV